MKHSTIDHKPTTLIDLKHVTIVLDLKLTVVDLIAVIPPSVSLVRPTQFVNACE
jgi:hypothetical protein